MNRYDPGTPRLASGLAAIAMTAATFALLVVLPSKMEADSQEYVALATISAALSAPCIVSPACSGAVARDLADAAGVPVRAALKCVQAG
jgi:hypothetical protein